MIIVAEISCNHMGSLDKAIKLVETAARVGADAIKLQTFTPEAMAVEKYVIEEGPWVGYDLRKLYQQAETPREWHKQLFELANDLGMIAFSTPFDIDSLEFLESIDCPMYKIASFEIVDLELIKACASTGKPLFISTGMASWQEIQEAAEAAKETDFTFLKCTSAYPAPFEDCNLRTMMDIKRKFGSVGLSDHTRGIAVPIAATALGASVIEKHLTLSRQEGLDAGFSLEPDEFKQMVTECRNAERAMGTTSYSVTPAERSSFNLRRSLYFAKDMKAGETITRECLITSRPNLGMTPSKLMEVLNHVIVSTVKAGDPLLPEMIGN